MRTASALLLTLTLLPVRAIQSDFPDFPFGDGELKTQAEYYTRGGKYRGGIPLYDNNYVFHACTTTNEGNISKTTDYWEDATACLSWGSNEVGSYETQYGRCSCASVMSNEYCDEWVCSDLEVYSAPCSGTEATTTAAAAATDVCMVEKAVKDSRCECERESVSGNFCASWVCLESDYDDGREYGDFRCVRASPTLEYCDAWTGVTDSLREVEFSSCACTHESSNATVCTQWECKLRGMEKCSHAGAGWCHIGYSVGIACLMGSLGAALAALGLSRLRKKNPPVSRACAGMDLCLGSFWMLAWSVGVVIWGGQNGAVVAIIWWGTFLAIGLLCACFNTRP